MFNTLTKPKDPEASTRNCARMLACTAISWFLLHACLQSAAIADETGLPKYRNTARDTEPPTEIAGLRVRLLTDRDFPPFSYQDEDGLQRGISVDLARAACQSLKLNCEIKMLPFGELLSALQKNEGDAIISGLRLDEARTASFSTSRPYYVSTGSFAIRNGRQLKDTTAVELAGRSIAVVRGTVHEEFLKRYYPKAGLKAYDTTSAMLADLKDGIVDAVFGDTLQLAFWLKGDASGQCCNALGRPFVDRETISRNLVFILPKDRTSLREAFDNALDRLEDQRLTAEIFARYVPAPLW
jgi:polar amino acid transport system substrate-binding protein